MSLMYFSIEKEVGFQGRTERFSNVYLYETAAADAAAYKAIVDALVAAERGVHGPSVIFRTGRGYTTNGLNFPGVPGSMYHVQDLGGVLGTGPGAAIYRECAFLVKWPLPRKGSSILGLGPPRSLKKFLHSCAGLGAAPGEIEGKDPLTATPKNALATYAAAVSQAAGGGPLVAPDGAVPNGAATAGLYLEHRQFPRGRKEN